MVDDDASSGPVPTRHVCPPSPTSTNSAITVGTSHDAVRIKNLESGEYIPDDDTWDDTRSLTESIRQHIIDGGLRYHAYHAGKYNFPNDETEQYRDDLKHNLTIHLCEGSYFYAPIHERLQKPGAEVLDLGGSLRCQTFYAFFSAYTCHFKTLIRVLMAENRYRDREMGYRM